MIAGAGIMLGVAAALGWLNELWALIPLGLLAALLVSHGVYDEWVKPRFRVGRRLTDWFLRRAWSVRVERRPGVDFWLNISSPSSKHEVTVTRDKDTPDDMIMFTGHILPLPAPWREALAQFPDVGIAYLEADIKAFLSAKDMSFNLMKSDQVPAWMPVVAITTAIAQDHTMSQQSVDVTAHSVELSIIGVRALIEKAVLRHVALRNAAASAPDAAAGTTSTPTPSPEPAPDTEEPQPQQAP